MNAHFIITAPPDKYPYSSGREKDPASRDRDSCVICDQSGLGDDLESGGGGKGDIVV
jgi:hypothetical protein